MNLVLSLQDSWAICRIFKKTNSTAQRALSHSWVSPLPETNASHHREMLTKDEDPTQFCLDSLTKKTSLANQFCTNQNDHLTTTTTTSSSNTLCPLDVASFKPIINPLLLYKPFDQLPVISNNGDLTFSSSPLEPPTAKPTTMDVSSMLLSMSSSMLGDFGTKTSSEGATFGGFQEQYGSNSNGYLIGLPLMPEGNGLVKMNHHGNGNVNVVMDHEQDQMERVRSDSNNNNSNMNGFALSGMPNLNIGDAWKSNLLWDSSSCPCDHVPSTYSTTKCYT